MLYHAYDRNLRHVHMMKTMHIGSKLICRLIYSLLHTECTLAAINVLSVNPLPYCGLKLVKIKYINVGFIYLHMISYMKI